MAADQDIDSTDLGADFLGNPWCYAHQVRWVPDMKEQRHRYRKKAFRAAFVGHGGSHVPSFCMVRDLSSHGARLQLAHGVALPEHFDLHINGRQQVLRAQTVWRTPTEVGVRFAGAPAAKGRLARDG